MTQAQCAAQASAWGVASSQTHNESRALRRSGWVARWEGSPRVPVHLDSPPLSCVGCMRSTLLCTLSCNLVSPAPPPRRGSGGSGRRKQPTQPQQEVAEDGVLREEQDDRVYGGGGGSCCLEGVGGGGGGRREGGKAEEGGERRELSLPFPACQVAPPGHGCPAPGPCNPVLHRLAEQVETACVNRNRVRGQAPCDAPLDVHPRCVSR